MFRKILKIKLLETPNYYTNNFNVVLQLKNERANEN